MKLTAIKPLVSNPHVYSVVVDNQYLGNISSQDVAELELSVGSDLNPDSLDDLSRRINRLKYFRAAQRYADRRIRSKKEVRQYLLLKGCEPELANAIVERLSSGGLIDDNSFTSAYIHDSLLKKPLSKRAIKHKLKTKGVDEKIVEQNLADADYDENKALDQMIERKQGLSQYADNQPKLFRYLMSQGFSYESIAKRIGRPQVSGRNRGGHLTAGD